MGVSGMLTQLGLTQLEQLDNIVIDSRMVRPGKVFVAIRTGHNFINDALERGADVVVSERSMPTKTIHVPDSIVWLGQAARLKRTLLSARVIGVTGSVGKTTLTQTLAQLFEKYGETHTTVGNQNNEIGAALTVLSAQSSSQFIIVEMGVAKPFDMDYLVDIVRPDISVITRIGLTHLDLLESTLGIWHEKSKIIHDASSVCIAPKQNFMRSGTSGHINVWFDSEHVILDSGQRLSYLYGKVPDVAFGDLIAGIYGVFHLLDLPFPDVIPKLLLKQRLSEHYMDKGALWIDDTYNASYLSYLRAIGMLSQHDGQRILVLGEMGGLGYRSEAIHLSLRTYLERSRIDHIIFYGPCTQSLFWSYSGSAQWLNKVCDLVAALKRYDTQGHTVLVKGSRHLQLEDVFICG